VRLHEAALLPPFAVVRALRTVRANPPRFATLACVAIGCRPATHGPAARSIHAGARGSGTVTSAASAARPSAAQRPLPRAGRAPSPPPIGCPLARDVYWPVAPET
jgi:hypothetical protein